MDLNLRRVILFTVIIAPLIMLFLLMLGITYTQASLLQNVERRQPTLGTSHHRTAPLPLADSISRPLVHTSAEAIGRTSRVHSSEVLIPTTITISVQAVHRYGMEVWVFTLACVLFLLFSLPKIVLRKTR